MLAFAATVRSPSGSTSTRGSGEPFCPGVPYARFVTFVALGLAAVWGATTDKQLVPCQRQRSPGRVQDCHRGPAWRLNPGRGTHVVHSLKQAQPEVSRDSQSPVLPGSTVIVKQ